MATETILFIIAIVLSFAILAFGSKTAAGLDRSRRRRHARRFALMALVPICVVFIVTLPVIVDYSYVEDIDPIEKVDLNTLENISKNISSQQYHIKVLEREVIRLREDVGEMNRYYRRLVYGVLWGIAAVGVGIMISEFGEPEKGEIKAEPLDLNDEGK